MFQERPYRQRRHSVLSIWSFVGLMAAGLTAWHLELLPFMHPSAADLGLSQVDEADLHPLAFEDMSKDPAAAFEAQLVAHHNEPDATTQQPAPAQMLGEAEPMPQPLAEMPRVEQAHSAPDQNVPVIRTVGYQNEYGIDTAPQQNATPAHDLVYRPDENPVVPQNLPNHQGDTVIQHLGYSEPAGNSGNIIQTAAATYTVTQPAAQAEPADMPAQQSATTPVEPAFQLDPALEADIRELRELSEQYWQQEDLRTEVNPELKRLAEKIYFQPSNHYLPGHKVQPGDQLRVIARNYDVPWQYLARLNRVEPEQIRIGETLKVIQGPFHAVVDISDKTLTVHAHGYYVCSFPVATGRDNATPTGEFPVLNKVENPTWYGPDAVVSANDPNNPLGEHWIDLGNGYGVHGTINPDSIGQAVSNGCVRLRPDDVALVYDLLTTNSKVLIRE